MGRGLLTGGPFWPPPPQAPQFSGWCSWRASLPPGTFQFTLSPGASSELPRVGGGGRGSQSRQLLRGEAAVTAAGRGRRRGGWAPARLPAPLCLPLHAILRPKPPAPAPGPRGGPETPVSSQTKALSAPPPGPQPRQVAAPPGGAV